MASPASGYGRLITDSSNRLYLKCTNCGVVFPSKLELAPEELEAATIEKMTHKCPVCANFDSYDKESFFYDH